MANVHEHAPTENRAETTGASKSPRARWPKLVAWALVLGAAHLALAAYYLPWSTVFGKRPIHGVDFDLHIGQVYRVVEGLEGWGKSWVYDVRLLAGQPEGAITDAGNKAWELWTYCLHHAGLSLPVAFNTWVLLTMLACPVLIYAAARNLELTWGSSLSAAAMASSLWFFDSFVHWVWFVGMVSWALASCLSVLTLSVFYRFMRTGKYALAAVCAICLAIGHLIHPYTFFILVAPLTAVYVSHRRQLPKAANLCVAAIVLFTLLVNAYWLIVAARHWHYVLNSAFFAQGKLSYIASDFLGILRAGENTGVIGVRSGFRVLYLTLAVAGLISWHSLRSARFWPFAWSIGGLLIVAYAGGSLTALAQMQPYRLLVPATLMTTIPAAWFVCEVFSASTLRTLSTSGRMLLVALSVAAGQHLLQDALYFLPRAIPETDRFSDGSPSPLHKYGFFARGLGPSHVTYSLPHDPLVEPPYGATIRWLESNVEKGSRLLVQGSVLGERLAWSTSFEVLGGFLERNVAHAYANYFRRHSESGTPEELAKYLRTYAVDYVISYAPPPEFERTDALVLVKSIGAYRVYRVEPRPGRVLEGRALVNARTNRIDIAGSDPQQSLVLSYHFHEALRCSPQCTIERAPETMSPVGAIRVPAPHPREFTIYNAYDWNRE